MKNGAHCSLGTSTCIYKHTLYRTDRKNEPDLWHYDELFRVNTTIISVYIGLQIYKIPLKNGCCCCFVFLLFNVLIATLKHAAWHGAEDLTRPGIVFFLLGR